MTKKHPIFPTMIPTRNASGARLRKWNESKEARADRIVIMHPESMPVVTENPPSFSTVQVLSKDRIVRRKLWTGQPKM
jgi:hypothetical protein